jgi:hypothetical protein
MYRSYLAGVGFVENKISIQKGRHKACPYNIQSRYKFVVIADDDTPTKVLQNNAYHHSSLFIIHFI